MQCTLPHIPIRLHSDNKITVNDFFIGEELYYRCSSGECAKPYQSISLYDISHNRNFGDNKKYPKEDVLFNIDMNTKIEKYENKEINVSVINTLNNDNTFEKTIVSEDASELIAKILLTHDPLPCMYPHCVFKISLNEITVTKENYDEVLNKKSRIFKNIRRDIRLELTSIIYSSRLDNDSDTEVIESL